MFETVMIFTPLALLLFSLPVWPYSLHWGFTPGGVAGLLLIIVLLLFFFGKI